MDFLQAFDDDDNDDLQPQPPASNSIDSIDQQQVVADAPHDNGLVSGNVAPLSSVSLPSLKGKLGKGRWGNAVEKQLMMTHMRACKAARSQCSVARDVSSVFAAIKPLCSRKQGLLSMRPSKTGKRLVMKVTTKRGGNQHFQSVPYQCFLDASFGKVKSQTTVAAALDSSVNTVKEMRIVAANCVMKRQMQMLGRLVRIAQRAPPLCTILRLKWDETSMKVKLNATGAPDDQFQSNWQTVVVRLTVLVVWHSGASVQLRLAFSLHLMYFYFEFIRWFVSAVVENPKAITTHYVKHSR
jgi:hypothetical protein